MSALDHDASGIAAAPTGTVVPPIARAGDDPDPAVAEALDAPDANSRSCARTPEAGVPASEADVARGLVARILGGDRTAEDELVLRYRRGVHRVLQNQGLSEWDIAELMQETWATALQKVRAFELREPAALGGFICGIARGKASNHRHAIVRHPTTSDPVQLDELVSEIDEPDRAVSHGQNKELVWQVLRSMLPRDREVLIRFMLYDEDRDEVCAVLGISTARFHGILYRAKQRFEKLLLTMAAGKEMEDDDD
jgi:RNA polymerase sigma-70 factor (ECF subfamily)